MSSTINGQPLVTAPVTTPVVVKKTEPPAKEPKVLPDKVHEKKKE